MDQVGSAQKATSMIGFLVDGGCFFPDKLLKYRREGKIFLLYKCMMKTLNKQTWSNFILKSNDNIIIPVYSLWMEMDCLGWSQSIQRLHTDI